MFNNRHVSAGWIFSKKLARFDAPIFEGERESFAEKAVWIETPKLPQLMCSIGDIPRLHASSLMPLKNG